MTSSSDKDSDPDSAEEVVESGEQDAASDEADSLQTDDPLGGDDDKPVIDMVPAGQSSDSKRLMGVGLVLIVLGALTGAAAGFFAGQMGTVDVPVTPAVDVDGALRPVEQRVDGLNDQVKQLRDQVTALQTDLADRPDVELPAPVDLEPIEKSLDDLQTRVAELDASVSQVQSSPSGTTGSGVRPDVLNDLSGSIEDLQASIASLETELPRRIARLESLGPAEDLDSRLGNFSTQEQYDDLAQRLSDLESGPSDTLAKQAALALGLANLVRAIELGQSFENELDTLVALSPTQPQLAELRPLAVNGLKRPERLKTEFLDLARLAIQKDSETPDASWWQQILMRFRALVTVRPVGEVEGETTEAVIARAELRLEEGDLRSAVTELRALDGPAAETLTDWLRDAEAHLQTEDLLQALSAEILRELGRLKG